MDPPNEPQQRRFYLLPKMHKSIWPDQCMPPGRPIISDVNSVSRQCASMIDFFLAPLAKLNPSYVRDSLHVLALVADVSVSKNSILFTMDVKSLYTNIPVTEGLQSVSNAFLKHPDRRRPDASVLSILRILLTSNDFEFRSERFLQVHGTAMGSAYGASFANIFLGEWEQQISEFPLQPKIWLRYIDDIFGIWEYNEKSLIDFTQSVNNLHPRINVTLNYSVDKISFLDLELYKSDSKLAYRIGFKPTHSFSILSPDSCHPSHVFRNVLFGELLRFCARSSTYEDFQKVKSLASKRWRRQGYSRIQIRNAVHRVYTLTQRYPDSWNPGFNACNCSVCKYSFSPSSVGDSSSNTTFYILHRLHCSDFNIIYLIVCKKCDARYVGQTSRTLRRRIGEHIANIKSRYASSVSSHFNFTCSLNDFSFTALEHCPNNERRLRKESQWIERLKTLVPNGLNESLNKEECLPLVLPHSECGQAVLRFCQRNVQNSHVRGAFRMHANLRQRLNNTR